MNISIQQPSLPTYRKTFFELLNKQVNVELYYGLDGVPVELPNIINKHYYPLILKQLGNFHFLWHYAQLKAVNRKKSVAILSWDVHYITLWISLIKSIFLNVPVILWGHGYSKNENQTKRFLRNIPVYFAKAVIVYDYHTAKELRTIYGFKNKIFTAPNSLDQKKIAIAKKYWKENKNRLIKFSHDYEINQGFNMVYIGRIYKENKLELLLEALSVLILTKPKVKLILIGKENRYVEQLKAYAQQLKVENNVIWTGAIYNENEIAPWMLSSHIFCYPANIGLSIMHAFGYGLPVITDSNYKAHNPEIWAFKNGENGLAYKPGDYCDLANKISQLYDDNDLRRRLSINAIQTIKTKYTIPNMVEGFMAAIKYVIKK